MWGGGVGGQFKESAVLANYLFASLICVCVDAVATCECIPMFMHPRSSLCRHLVNLVNVFTLMTFCTTFTEATYISIEIEVSSL